MSDERVPFSQGGPPPDGVRLTVEGESDAQRSWLRVFWICAWSGYALGAVGFIAFSVLLQSARFGGELSETSLYSAYLAAAVGLASTLTIVIAGLSISKSDHRRSRFTDHERKVARMSWIYAIVGAVAIQVCLGVMGFSSAIFAVSAG